MQRRSLLVLGALACTGYPVVSFAQPGNLPPGASVERHDPYGPDSGPDIWVRRPPPSPRREPPPAARRGFVWVPGHWVWNGRAYRWVSGRYVRARTGMRYVPARWEQGPRGWRYYEGYWTR